MEKNLQIYPLFRILPDEYATPSPDLSLIHISKDCIKCRPKCVPRSPAASRVHANSISAVSSPQPKEDASSFPSCLLYTSIKGGNKVLGCLS